MLFWTSCAMAYCWEVEKKMVMTLGHSCYQTSNFDCYECTHRCQWMGDRTSAGLLFWNQLTCGQFVARLAHLKNSIIFRLERHLCCSQSLCQVLASEWLVFFSRTASFQYSNVLEEYWNVTRKQNHWASPFLSIRILASRVRQGQTR